MKNRSKTSSSRSHIPRFRSRQHLGGYRRQRGCDDSYQGKDVVLSPTGPHAHHLAQAPAFTAEGPSVDIRYQVLLVDGDSLRTYEAVQELRVYPASHALHEAKWAGRDCCAPPEEADSAETRSVRRGLEGLNRSLAKELVSRALARTSST